MRNLSFEFRDQPFDSRAFQVRLRAAQVAGNDRKLRAGGKLGNVALPFSLFPTLRSRACAMKRDTIWHSCKENKDEDADFGVILPEPLTAGKTYKLSFEYSGGDVLVDVGGGNFFVNPGARETWYPNNEGSAFGDRATFDVTCRYPKSKTLIGTARR